MATSELLLTNGTTPATPASGKTKVFINASKQLSQVDDAGLVTVLNGQNAVSQSTPADPTGTTSTAGVMMGLAGAITPQYTGRALIVLTGNVANSTLMDGINVQLRYGTGSAPANGGAATGTAIGALNKTTSAVNAQKTGVALQAIVTGLTLATAIWIDVTLAAVTGGTVTLTNVSLSALEI
jgi:hypothetical protein